MNIIKKNPISNSYSKPPSFQQMNAFDAFLLLITYEKYITIDVYVLIIS